MTRRTRRRHRTVLSHSGSVKAVVGAARRRRSNPAHPAALRKSRTGPPWRIHKSDIVHRSSWVDRGSELAKIFKMETLRRKGTVALGDWNCTLADALRHGPSARLLLDGTCVLFVGLSGVCSKTNQKVLGTSTWSVRRLEPGHQGEKAATASKIRNLRRPPRRRRGVQEASRRGTGARTAALSPGRPRVQTAMWDQA